MKTIGERVESIRKERGLRQTQLIKKAGVKLSTYGRLEHDGGDPLAITVLKVCGVLGVSMEYLMTGKERVDVHSLDNMTYEEVLILKKLRGMEEPKKTLILEILEAWQKNKKKTRSIRTRANLPKDSTPIEMRIYDVRVSAGLGFYLDNESTYEMRTFDADDVPAGADFGMRIAGESMAPTIEDGSVVWIKPMPAVENRQIGIFILNNELLCKELRIDPAENKIRLHSHNPAYKPIGITEDDAFGTVGRVLL